MNSTQRNFKKQMEEAKRQGVLPDSYRPNRFRTITFKEHKVGFSVAGISLVGVLIFCWNVFALGTWINAFFQGASPLNAVNSSVLNKNKLAIHEFISNNSETQKILGSSMQMVSDIYVKRVKYNIGTIRTQHETLLKYKYTINTDNKYLVELRDIYLKEFNLVENALIFAENNYGKNITQSDVDYLNNIFGQIRQISIDKNNAYIELFKKAKIKYSISNDGAIRYEYTN